MFSPSFKRDFFSFQVIVSPRAAHFSETQKQNAIHIVENFLASKPTVMKTKLKAFFVLLNVWSVLRFGKRFSFLDPSAQNKIAQDFFDSPVSLFRKAFWGVSTIAKLSVYGQEGLYPELNYSLKKWPRG